MRATRGRGAAALGAALLIAAACAPAPQPPVSDNPPTDEAPGPVATASPPAPGHELFGFVPYWEMDDGIATHVRSIPLTTLALFSVTHTARGAIDTTQTGYRRITGDIGRQLIREARDRGTRVELVWTSFGAAKNAKLFGDPALQDAVIASLVALGGELGVDGIDADVEGLDPLLVPAYGAFVGRLRAAVVGADPGDVVSISTPANGLGAAMAAAAGDGADRVFVMGYDYRTSGSEPGASAPLARRDGDPRDLPSSLDLYATLGVPVDRTVLGLPLYGMAWPVAEPVVGAPRTGPGEPWIPRRNVGLLLDAAAVPVRDEIEQVEVYLLGSDGSIGPPSPGTAAPTSPAAARTWQAIYVDSPATLAPKLELANARGLAGAGFWAIGYERGLPGYADLMARFAAGEPPG